MLTMVLGGLWHGANWTFVAWGVYHGLLLCGFRMIPGSDPKPKGTALQRLRWLLGVLLMFQLTCIGWLLFRADSIVAAANMFAALLGEWHASILAVGGLAMIAFFAGPMFIWESTFGAENRLPQLANRRCLAVALLMYVLMMLLITLSQRRSPSEFIYFQF